MKSADPRGSAQSNTLQGAEELQRFAGHGVKLAALLPRENALHAAFLFLPFIALIENTIVITNLAILEPAVDYGNPVLVIAVDAREVNFLLVRQLQFFANIRGQQHVPAEELAFDLSEPVLLDWSEDSEHQAVVFCRDRLD